MELPDSGHLRTLARALVPLVVEEIAARAQTPCDAEQALLDEAAAARFLGMQSSTLSAWRSRGGGPPFLHVGDGKRPAVRYARADLIAWAQQRRMMQSHQPAADTTAPESEEASR